MKIFSTLVIMMTVLIAAVIASYNNKPTVYSELDSSELSSSENSTYSAPAHYASEEEVSPQFIWGILIYFNLIFENFEFRHFKGMKRKKMKLRPDMKVKPNLLNTAIRSRNTQLSLTLALPLRLAI